MAFLSRLPLFLLLCHALAPPATLFVSPHLHDKSESETLDAWLSADERRIMEEAYHYHHFFVNEEVMPDLSNNVIPEIPPPHDDAGRRHAPLSAAEPDGRTLVCYFSNWAQYRSGIGHFLPENIDPFLCTHLHFAFAVVKDDELSPFEWNDLDNKWGECRSREMFPADKAKQERE